MKKIKLGINGFGRIGRLALRLAEERHDIEVVGINDIQPLDYLAYNIRYDSVHGRFKGTIEYDMEKNIMIVNGRDVRIFAEKDPRNIPWGELGADYVLESTGLFLTKESCQAHIDAGAKYVIMSAPSKDDTPMFVYGVNHRTYEKGTQFVSNASCTTNCLAPIAKVLNDNWGIEMGLMATIHAVTAKQRTVDGNSIRDWRGGRAAFVNIIPSTTGAAKAVGRVIPELKGKLTGTSYRVPTVDVSVVDLVALLKKPATYEEICEAMKKASEEGDLKGILGYTDDQLVSTDFVDEIHSSIFDKQAGLSLNENFVKVVSWYDNEMSYARRVCDLLTYMARVNNE